MEIQANRKIIFYEEDIEPLKALCNYAKITIDSTKKDSIEYVNNLPNNIKITYNAFLRASYLINIILNIKTTNEAFNLTKSDNVYNY